MSIFVTLPIDNVDNICYNVGKEANELTPPNTGENAHMDAVAKPTEKYFINGFPLPSTSEYCEDYEDLEIDLLNLENMLNNYELALFWRNGIVFRQMVKGYMEIGQPFPTKLAEEYERLCARACFMNNDYRLIGSYASRQLNHNDAASARR